MSCLGEYLKKWWEESLNFCSRLNERILSGAAHYLDLTGCSKSESNRPRDITARIMNKIQYFTKKQGVKKALPTTHWVIADLEVFEGRALLRHALTQMVCLK